MAFTNRVLKKTEFFCRLTFFPQAHTESGVKPIAQARTKRGCLEAGKYRSSQLLRVSGCYTDIETGCKRACQLQRLAPQPGLECRTVRLAALAVGTRLLLPAAAAAQPRRGVLTIIRFPLAIAALVH